LAAHAEPNIAKRAASHDHRLTASPPHRLTASPPHRLTAPRLADQGGLRQTPRIICERKKPMVKIINLRRSEHQRICRKDIERRLTKPDHS
jgi:hypothetical protein